ncbi:hypothetical protein GGI06_000244, partial [Coemansia sp. S85]
MLSYFKRRTNSLSSTWTPLAAVTARAASEDDKNVSSAATSQDEGSRDQVTTMHVPGQAQRTGSSTGALLNLVCIVIGTGSLNLPRTLQQSGWIGLLLIAICGVISTFTGILIIKSLNMMDASRVRNFNQIGQAAFGTTGRVIIYILYFVNVMGIVGDYIILAGQSFHQIANGRGLSESGWKLVCAAVMWLGCISLKQMSEAAILSFVGIVTSMGAILIGVVQAFMHPYRDNGMTPVAYHPAVHETARGSGVALALATISFAFCAVSVMPSVESSMRRPDKWNSVLGLSMAIIGTTYIF